MLSILIPTYQYDVTELVIDVFNQCTSTQIPFEIIVLEDGSNVLYKNETINNLSNCSFNVLPKNIGRSAIRNLLAKKAQYPWLLFLDADVKIINNTFIENYLKIIRKENTPKIIYGGIVYPNEKPPQKQLLRWVYGNEREAIKAEKRNKEKYLSFLTLNFIIHKSIFQKVPFNEEIPNLRNEDLLFSYDLQQKQIPIIHINNQVCHLGIETTDIFIKKTNEVSVSYLYLWNEKLLPYAYTPYGKVYEKIQSLKLKKIISIGFILTKPILIKNLKSKTPSMFVYDLYRLGHICSLNNEEVLNYNEKHS